MSGRGDCWRQPRVRRLASSISLNSGDRNLAACHPARDRRTKSRPASAYRTSKTARGRPQEASREGHRDQIRSGSATTDQLRGGDLEAPLRWTCKSVRQLTELKRLKHQVSHQLVADLLHELGYSLQANRKTKEGTDCRPERPVRTPERKGEVEFGRNQPVISVDTKNEELVEISRITVEN